MSKINSLVNISTKQIVDRLSRAYEMEEAMGERLLGLCRMDEPIADLSAEAQAIILKMLDNIRADSLRHKQTVLGFLNELSRRGG